MEWESHKANTKLGQNNPLGIRLASDKCYESPITSHINKWTR